MSRPLVRWGRTTKWKVVVLEVLCVLYTCTITHRQTGRRVVHILQS